MSASHHLAGEPDMTATTTLTRSISDLRDMGYDMDDTRTVALLGVLFARPRHAGAPAIDDYSGPACRHGADEGCSGAMVYDARHADAEAVYAGCI